MNSDSASSTPGIRYLVAAASLVVIVAGLRSAQSVLVPFALAVFLAIVAARPLLVLSGLKVPRVIAVLVVGLVMVGGLFFIGSLLSSSVEALSQSIPEYRIRAELLLKQITSWLKEHRIPVSSESILQDLNTGAVFEMVGRTTGKLVSTVSTTVLVIIFTLFILYEATGLTAKLKVAAVQNELDYEQLQSMSIEVERYLAIKTVTSLFTGLLVGALTYFSNLDFPILWGAIAFVLNYIPFIGSIIAAIPAVLLATLLLGGAGASGVALGYIVINVGISNFIEPMLMGPRLGLSPFIVLLSLVFWGWVWGPVGMLLSIPLTMTAKILLEHSEELRWIGILMDVKPRKS